MGVGCESAFCTRYSAPRSDQGVLAAPSQDKRASAFETLSCAGEKTCSSPHEALAIEYPSLVAEQRISPPTRIPTLVAIYLPKQRVIWSKTGPRSRRRSEICTMSKTNLFERLCAISKDFAVFMHRKRAKLRSKVIKCLTISAENEHIEYSSRNGVI
jgi:hypothetical protein